MLVNFGCGIRLQSRSSPFFSKFKPLNRPPPSIIHNSKTLSQTLAMATLTGPDNRRPVCPSCSRPTRVCFCSRFKTPVLENPIAVTLLQHSLEKKHPLNSAKIATLGLKNVNLVHVSDVLSEARFDLHLLESNPHLGPLNSVENRKKVESSQPADISFTVGKQGVITSLVHTGNDNQDFDKLLVDKSTIDDLRNGFTVKKIQSGGDGNYVEEFDIIVPPGSVLLFPSENSIGIEDIDFKVENLIVLDGTWAKATRMHKENPWLKLLPHLKLDINKLSLYGEVRRQPKAGYLSSIESIVYTLKAIGGNDLKELDCLLDVFESMVGDQRRCMNERLNFEINSGSM